MRVELPEFKRCCCCVPLRYGLLAWTYIRIIYLVLLIIMISSTLYREAVWDHPYHRSATTIVLQSGLLIWLILDVAFNIVFLVGGHTKNVKLLKVQYYYNMVSLGLFVLVCTVTAINMIINYYQVFFYIHFLFIIMISDLCLCVAGVVMQVYTLLLTRSEIRKLASNVEFRFENNAAEAQCVAVADESGFDPCNKGVPPAKGAPAALTSIHVKTDQAKLDNQALNVGPNNPPGNKAPI